MLACIAGNHILSEMLLRAGADAKLKDTEGMYSLLMYLNFCSSVK